MWAEVLSLSCAYNCILQWMHTHSIVRRVWVTLFSVSRRSATLLQLRLVCWAVTTEYYVVMAVAELQFVFPFFIILVLVYAQPFLECAMFTLVLNASPAYCRLMIWTGECNNMILTAHVAYATCVGDYGYFTEFTFDNSVSVELCQRSDSYLSSQKY